MNKFSHDQFDKSDVDTARAPPLQTDDREERRRIVDAQRRMVLAAAFLGSIGSLALSFVGTVYNLERDGGDNFETIAAALIISLVVAAFQMVGWWVLLETRSFSGVWRKLGGVLCVLTFLGFGYGTSSYFNYTSVTSASATVIYVGDVIRERTAALDALRRRANIDEQLLSLVEAEKEAGCAAAELEAEKGIYSGSGGKGLVSGALDGVCRRSATAEGAMSEARARANRASESASAVFERLDDLMTDVDMPILVRERQAQAMIRSVDADLRDIVAASMTQSALAYFAGLQTTMADIGSNSQQAALTLLRKGFEERLPNVKALISASEAIKVPEPALPPRPAVHEMMLHSVEKHPQNALLALGIDTFAAFFCLVLILKEPTRRQGA